MGEKEKKKTEHSPEHKPRGNEAQISLCQKLKSKMTISQQQKQPTL